MSFNQSVLKLMYLSHAKNIDAANAFVSDGFLPNLPSRYILTNNTTTFDSLDEFYKHYKIPLSLKEFYGVMEIPTCELAVIDTLTVPIQSAVAYALTHGHVTYHALYSLFSYNDIKEINQFDCEFADFFRRNVIVHAEKTYDVFRSVKDVPGAKNLKDANLRRFAAYAMKRGIKQQKVYNFVELIEKGDGLAALDALIS